MQMIMDTLLTVGHCESTIENSTHQIAKMDEMEKLCTLLEASKDNLFRSDNHVLFSVSNGLQANCSIVQVVTTKEWIQTERSQNKESAKTQRSLIDHARALSQVPALGLQAVYVECIACILCNALD
jgi:hypothetical protein